jgi:hypothetical protein
MPVSTKIQVRRDTAANWTSTNPTLAAGEIGFETDTGKFKIGTGALAWTNASLKYSQDASLLSGAATLTTLTTTGAVVVGGNLTVNGTTTSINSSTIQVDDKNLELGSVAGVAGVSATVESGTSTVLTATAYNFIVGQSVTRTAGAAYAGGSIASIVSPTEFTVTGTFGATGSVTLTIGGADDNTADGAGITVKGSTDKTFNYTNATSSWTSNQDLNLVSGKVYEINGTTVLSSTQVLGFAVATANGASTIVSRDASGNFAAGTITASLTGTASLATNISAGTAGQLLYQSGANATAKLAVTATNNQVLSYNTSTNAPQWTAITGTGNVVYSTSPVLTTPNIGVPSFATLTNATGLPVGTGISGLGTGVATALAVNTGSAGAFVVVGGALGTPSSGNLASTNGYATANLTGLGTNVATFLATPTSANFLTTVTGATGNGGGVVFANNATLVAPTLGVASATSLNKVTVTAPATAATLTLADGSTLATSGNYSITLTGTATTNVTLPTSGTLATQTFVGSATVAQANNLTGTTPNLIPYQSASNTTTFLAAPAGNNYVLSANTTGAPYWAAASATGVTSISAGTGMSFTTITGTGSVSIDTAVVPRFASTGTFTATQTFQNASNASAGLIVKNHATQQANVFEIQYGGNTTPMVSVSNTGTLFAVTIDGGSA